MSRRDSRAAGGPSPRARLNPKLGSIAIGDRVRIAENRVGEVRFIGPTDFHDGIWYGVALDRPEGKHNGTFRGRKYFECERHHGSFVQRDRIEDIVAESAITPLILRLDYADVVNLPDRGRGYIRFVGNVHFQSELWFGIELQEEKGKNNGTVQGVRYFSCLQKHGIMLNGKKLSAQLEGQPFIGIGSPPAHIENSTAEPRWAMMGMFDPEDEDADDEDDDEDYQHLEIDDTSMSRSKTESSSSFPYHEDVPYTNRLHSVDEEKSHRAKTPTPPPPTTRQRSAGLVEEREDETREDSADKPNGGSHVKISIDEAELKAERPVLSNRDRSHTFHKISIDSTQNAPMISFEHGKMNIKCVMFGDTKVGKTCLVRRFTRNRFTTRYKMTVGYQKTVRECEVPVEIVEEVDDDVFLFGSGSNIDERNLTSISNPNGDTVITNRREGCVDVALQIIDAGLHAQNTDELKGVTAIVLVADFAKRSSMDQLVRWYRTYIEQTPQDTKRRRSSHFRKHKKDLGPQQVVIVVANKCELDASRRMFTMDELITYVDSTLRPFIIRANSPAIEVNDSPFPPSMAELSATVLTPRSQELANMRQRMEAGEELDDDDDEDDNLERTLSTTSQSSVRDGTDFIHTGAIPPGGLGPKIPIEVLECSAKTGENVELIFQTIMKHLVPPRLVSSSHKRKKTAQIRAPLLIRRALQAYESDPDEDSTGQQDTSTTNLGFTFGGLFESSDFQEPDDAQELDDRQAYEGFVPRMKFSY